jgi:23S rRNA (adenine2503-C2)-methyltransferase
VAGSAEGKTMAAILDLAPTARPSGDAIVPVAMVRPQAVVTDAKPHLIGMSREQLGEVLLAVGVPPKQIRMRTAQLWHWLYVRGVADFGQMINMSRDLRQKLSEVADISRPEIVDEQISVDGTRKWLFRFAAKGAGRPVEIETVYIPEEGRGTLCVSSQVGCTLTCTFCHTGTQRLVRNLTPDEIVGQIMVARDRLGDFPDADTPEGGILPSEGRLVSNVVMMGMGEPLYNFDNVRQALAVVTDGEGLALSRRRVTLSTSGVVPMISRTGDEMGVGLAISLHAVRDELRDVLVPINKKYPLAELLEACRTYPGVSNARRITFEYVMLKGVNDSLGDARELVRLLKGIPAKINLIPFNPWPGTDYECSDWDQIERFADVVNQAGYASPIRTPRGRDIFAACGQLKSESERMRKTERMAAGL